MLLSANQREFQHTKECITWMLYAKVISLQSFLLVDEVVDIVRFWNVAFS